MIQIKKNMSERFDKAQDLFIYKTKYIDTYITDTIKVSQAKNVWY